jgi:hypothetical protein
LIAGCRFIVRRREEDHRDSSGTAERHHRRADHHRVRWLEQPDHDQAPDSTFGPSNNETTRRIVVLVFGLIQIVLGLRIVLLLVDARTGNLLVSIINNVGGLLAAPFQGILRISAVSSGGSVLDVAAVVALVGWTIIELVVIWSLAIFRHEPALA